MGAEANAPIETSSSESTKHPFSSFQNERRIDAASLSAAAIQPAPSAAPMTSARYAASTNVFHKRMFM